MLKYIIKKPAFLLSKSGNDTKSKLPFAYTLPLFNG